MSDSFKKFNRSGFIMELGTSKNGNSDNFPHLNGAKSEFCGGSKCNSIPEFLKDNKAFNGGIRIGK